MHHSIPGIRASQADLAWNELVVGLKKDTYSANEKSADAEQALKPLQERNSALEAELTAAKARIAACQDVMMGLAAQSDPPIAMHSDFDPIEFGAKLQGVIKSNLDAQTSKRESIQLENENMSKELQRVKQDARVELNASRREVTQQLAMLKEEQLRQQQAEQEYGAAVKELNDKIALIEEKKEALDVNFQEEMKGVCAKLTESEASLQASEQRCKSVALYKQDLEQALAQERVRTQTAQQEAALMRDSITKIAQACVLSSRNVSCAATAMAMARS